MLAITVLGTGCAQALSTQPAGAVTAPTTWLCRPGQPDNPCGGNSGAPVDCFYVYPTVSLDPGANSDLRPGLEERTVAAQQAAPFSSACTVWAPMYRQSTLRGLFAASDPTARNAALERAYQDVVNAWTDYLTHHNRGRGVVLIGHSQGTYLLRALIRERIENTTARKQLISALLIGGNVLVRKGSTTGGDFTTVPACTARGQIGCVVAYSAYGRTPPPDTRFGTAPRAASYGPAGRLPFGPQYSVLCTNPAALGSTASAVLHGTLPGGLPSSYSARCTTGAGPHVLQLRGGSPVPANLLPELPQANWGLHLLDIDVADRDLVGLVRSQTATYLATAGR
ncbi:DUF3089 domain-containing protein [Williamsia sp. CHRR-6]|nr:DUF3089 domain-containing protein [Williamsia sp. CHRR-6]